MSYTDAKTKYAQYGVDADAAIERLKTVPVSLHCWQGDDVRGFDTDPSAPLTGGIQTTGNYPGRARTPEELMADLDQVLKLIPGRPKMNLHASYAIFAEGEWADRDKLEPKHFEKWVEFCKARGLGCDFNPTFFSHPNCDPLTLSSPNEATRKFWIDHGKACIRISAYLAEELNEPCVMNIWTGDGFKDVPGDRLGPRIRYKESIDAILSEPYDFAKVKPCIESKVFGIGVEAYTVGSGEFALSYAAMNRDKCIPLMDNGHYHPTEVVSDKIPALLTFFPEIALHVTRPIRWDSDHVVLFDDETKEIAREIVRCGGLEGRVHIALDYFDASINRISAYLAEELGQPCVMNIWTGDGFKDVPGDRLGPRVRYKESIDAILSEPYDFNKVKPCIESKVFGIGVEAYTVGSGEFALSYAAMNKDRCIPLMDNGHYHPTEVVSDKIPALLAFFPEIALHVTRPIRWDSDHVVLFDDETREIAREIVRCGGLDGRVHIALDYFDASINRISAWVTGYRNLQKALLFALLQPNDELKALQDTGDFTKLMVVQEELKTLPFGEVWDEYCRRCGKPADGEWFIEIETYEREVLEARA